MLIYEPENRATAQQMIDNEWLYMEPNFEYKMSEREYEKMSMFKKSIKAEKKVVNDRDTVDSEAEQNKADDDNSSREEEFDEEDSYIEPPTDIIEIQNFNNSFAIYGQHVKLSALDKANPQFKK